MITRRAFLASGLAAGLLARRVWGATPAIEVLDRRVISWKAPLYHGWPTMAQRENGELLLAFSGGRESHVCPFGRLELKRSIDGGVNWKWPQVIYDGPIDDRDAGICITPTGTILLTNFTSLAYQKEFDQARKIAPGQPGAWDDLKLREWTAAHERLTEEQRQAELGCWMIRSTDGGVNWSARYRVPCNSPHGPIALNDGRLLYLGIGLWDPQRAVGAWESRDDGVTWKSLGSIPVREGDRAQDYHELHGVQTAGGRILCHIRNHNPNHRGETLQSHSDDGGRTWSTPRSIGVWGLPSHLLRLRDGRLMLSYGYRRKPFGIQVRLSDLAGDNWGEPLTLADDGSSGDLGYPSTVERPDGSFVTVWYERLASSPLAQLRQARWRWGT